jgi:purine-nucleoside phosphorylase
MSTVCETIAARHCGLDVAAFSLVTNLAAGRGGTLSHAEVAEVAERAAADTCGFLTDLITAL